MITVLSQHRGGSRSLAVVVAVLVALVAAATASAAPVIGIDKSAPERVLFGEDSLVSVTITNTGPDYGYNASIRDQLPNGVSFVPGSATLGDASGPGSTPITPQITPNTPSAGSTVLVFPNITDVSPGSSQVIWYRVRHSQTTLAVGSSYTNSARAYATDDPRYLPRFDVATGTPSNPPSGTTIASPTDTATTRITAIQIAKSEPSPESELLRGVHEHQTTYTLTVTNNKVNPTGSIEVDDWLPAGLEFLGCADVDNSSQPEYENAPSLIDGDGASPAGCLTPALVETVTTDPDGGGPLPTGVYTHVRWSVPGQLAAGGDYTIRYKAGVPLRENTATWPGATPSPASLGQMANLDNNTGPETTDEQVLTNRAAVSGRYNPAVGGGVVVDDATTHTVTAEDLAIQKAADTPTIAHGATTTWTLTLRASEYRDANTLTITDTVPDGLCPLGGSTSSVPGDTSCLGTVADAPSLPYSGDPVEQSGGSFRLTWTGVDVGHSQVRTITFRTYTRSRYREDFADAGPVLRGDSWTNTVHVAGTSTQLCDDATRSPTPCAPGVAPIGTLPTTLVPNFDGSEASQTSAGITISKLVAVPPPTGPLNCNSASITWVPITDSPRYRPGDRVCWKVRVDFGSAVDTDVSTLTDFLPADVQYVPGTDQPTDDNTLPLTATPPLTSYPSAPGGTIEWRLDDPVVGTNDYVFERTFQTEVQRDVTDKLGDIVSNLFKVAYRDTNGRTVPLRAEATFQRDEPHLAIDKTTQRVIVTGTEPRSTLDSRTVTPFDDVEYRVRVRNDGGSAASSTVIWDALPPGITCAAIQSSTPTGTCTDNVSVVVSGTTTTRSRIQWTGVSVSARVGSTNGVTDLYYVLRAPVSPPGTSHVNTAGIVSYVGPTNQSAGTTFTYTPADNIDPAQTSPNTPSSGTDIDGNAFRTTDPTTILIAGPTQAKTRTATSHTDASGDNTAATATIGEIITYESVTTLPRGTTYSGRPQLVDDMATANRLQLVTGDASYPITVEKRIGTGAYAPVTLGSGPNDVTLTTTGNQLVLLLPTDYATSTAGNESYRVTYSAQVRDVPANAAGSPVPNQATFSYKATPTGPTLTTSQSVSTQIVEPWVVAGKTRTPSGPVEGSQILTYTVTGTNSPLANTSASYDSRLVDAVPADLTPLKPNGDPVAATGDPVGSDANPGVWNATNRTITWEVGTIGKGASVSREYRAQVIPGVPVGTELINNVDVTGTSLPGDVSGERGPGPGLGRYRGRAMHTAVVGGAPLTKSVDPATATVGEDVQFTVNVTLPSHTTLLDFTVRDLLPDGLAYVAGSSTVTCAPAGPGCSTAPVFPTTVAPLATTATAGRQQLTWFFDDVAAATTSRTITLTYTARVLVDYRQTADGKVRRGDTLTNSVTSHTNRTNKVSTPEDAASATFDDSSTPATSTVTVKAPELGFDKKVAIRPAGGSYGTPVDSGTTTTRDSYRYEITVTNNGDSPAYNVDVKDVYDSDLRNVAPLSPAAFGSHDTATRTLGWRLAGPIQPGASEVIQYTAELAPDDQITGGKDGQVINRADLLGYKPQPSDDDDRYGTGSTANDTVTLNVNMPVLEIAKTPDAGVAHAGETPSYQVVVRNTGDAPATDLVVTDALGAKQSYVGGTATATRSDNPGGTWFTETKPAAAAPPTVVVGADSGTDREIHWHLTALPAGQTATITVPVTIDSDAGARTVENTASVTAPELPSTSTNPPTDDGSFTTTALTDMQLTKRFDQANGNAGEAVSFVLTATNAGPSDATGVSITDTLPAELTFISADAGCTAVGQVVTCDAGEMVVGTSKQFTVRARIDSGFAGNQITNSATVTSTTPEDPSTLDDNTDSDTIVSLVDARLALVKSAPATAVQTQTFDYTMVVRSVGVSDAVAATLSDTLPAGTSFVAVRTDRGTCADPAAPTDPVTCAFGTMRPGDSATVVVTVRADGTGAVTNTATAETPSNPTPVEDEATVTIDPAADLRLSKRAVESEVAAGGVASFVLTATNDGPSPAENAKITDTLPAGTEFVDGDGCTAAGESVTCELGTIAVGASVERTIRIRVPHALGGQQITNIAIVGSTTADPDESNNNDDATVTVGPSADVAVTKTAGPATAGGTVQWTIAIQNNGPSTAVDVTVADDLPAGTTLVGVTPSRGGCTGDRQIRCALGDLPSGAAAQVVIVANVDRSLEGTTIRNGATVSTTTPDPDEGNNSSTVDTPVVSPSPNAPMLEITKRALTESPAVGRPLTYELTVTNRGAVAAVNARVLDTMDDSVVVASATTSGGTCTIDDSTIRCTLRRIDPHETETIRVVVYPTRTGPLRNSASVSTPGQQSTVGVPIAGANVNVTQRLRAKLALTKKASRSKVRPGKTVTFTIRARNVSSNRTATRLRVCDRLPAGLSYVRARGATIKNGRACWQVGHLKPRASRTFTIVARAQASTKTRRIRNVATVTSANAGKRSAAATVRVGSKAARRGGVTG